MSELIIGLIVLVALSYVGVFLIAIAFWLAHFAWTNTLPGRRGVIIAWGTPALVVCMCCSTPIILPIAYHNFDLYQLEQRIYTYPFPTETEVISREGSITAHTGNGDYCIFTIRQTMKTTLRQSEISAYYAEVELQGLSTYPRPVLVTFGGTATTTNELRFTIEISEMSERFFDIRC